MSYPKVVALGIEWVIFSGDLDQNKWGKGSGARSKLSDNILRVSDSEIQDRTNSNHKCHLYPDIPRIVGDILKHGAKLAIVSQNTSKALTDRALYYMMVKDKDGNDRRLIELVNYDEVYNEPKTVHFEKIHGYRQVPYMDMVLYDHVKQSTIPEMLQGVTFQYCPSGLTWDLYQTGLSIWRGTKAIHSPWHGLALTAYPNRKLIGYSGMDHGTIELLEKGGRRHDRKEAARWGHGMYVADDPLVARYFRDWIKVTTFGPASNTTVCEVYARDGEIWDKMNKIWVPDNCHDLKTHVDKGDEHIAESDIKRDGQVADWGVLRPYVLFCRHPNMKDRDGMQFPIPEPKRFNEMVIYGQTQENLIVIRRMSDAQLEQAINNKVNLEYEHKIREWNIKVPGDTKADFRKHHENPTL
ncbi:hypothetical protein E1B28_005025 [Marasmius oreades]|uniref:Uncharacterized protein n=1 Tax=Marasmius oreades TaxID=181124 RepID=A0A9P7V006_9AGAR|nr:uncharacterized protein E1B28_005025 [Marasmius oreades]KAG7097700.1 hypothetical protein E1B28_005025 [Marasmius oreades]